MTLDRKLDLVGVGMTLIGLLTLRLAFRPVASVTLVGMGVAIAVFGVAESNYLLTVATSVATGFAIFGAAVVLYASGAATFPARVRATGMGLSMTAGRLGAFVGPLVAGLMLDNGAGRMWTCLLLAVPVVGVVCSAIALGSWPHLRSASAIALATRQHMLSGSSISWPRSSRQR